MAANNAQPAPSDDSRSWIVQLDARISSAEQFLSKLAPLQQLLPVLETVVAAADPAVAAPVAAGVEVATGVANVVDDLLASLRQHFGEKTSAQIGLPAPGVAVAAVSDPTPPKT